MHSGHIFITWPKVAPEAIFPNNWGYVCIEYWSKIFVSLSKVDFSVSLTLSSGTFGAGNVNLRPLFNTNVPPISGNYGLRKHFWPLEIGFLMWNSEKRGLISKEAR